MSLCGIPEAELEAPDWLLVEGLALLSVDGVAELDGFVLWSVELEEEGEVALPEVEGEVLCELLEDDGAELDDGELWSDCGRVELLELLVEELPFTDGLGWLLLGDALD